MASAKSTREREKPREVQTWERQDDEPENAYEAFKGYCFQTPPRRLAHSSVKFSTSELSKLFNEWRWKERSLAWDRHTDRIRLDEREALIKQDEKDRLAKWMTVLETTGEILSREMAKLLRDSQETQASGLIKPSDLNKLMATWIQMQRLIHGQSTENVAVDDARLENLTLDELRELHRLQEKIAPGEDDEPAKH